MLTIMTSRHSNTSAILNRRSCGVMSAKYGHEAKNRPKRIIHAFLKFRNRIYTTMQVKSVDLVRIVIISWRFSPLLCVFKLQRIPTMHF